VTYEVFCSDCGGAHNPCGAHDTAARLCYAALARYLSQEVVTNRAHSLAARGVSCNPAFCCQTRTTPKETKRQAGDPTQIGPVYQLTTRKFHACLFFQD